MFAADDDVNLDHAAQCFAALGSPQRLAVLHALVAAGLPAGVLAQRVGVGASTLTHHLGVLARSGLVRQERQGRSIITWAEFGRVRTLSSYLMRCCCTDAPAPAGAEGTA